MQLGSHDDVAQLRQFLGMPYPAAVRALQERNEPLLRNTGGLAPAQAAAMRQEMKPPAMPAGARPIIALNATGIGRGLVLQLFEDDFLTDQVNLIFCRDPERIISVQVLFDDSRALGDTVAIFRKIYRLPSPVPADDYHPAMRYSLAGVRYDDQGAWQIRADAPRITVWDLGPVEAVQQNGQLWITDKAATASCPEQ
jgi:hypothetical protein